MKIPTQKIQICVGIFFATLYIFTKTHFFYFMRKLFSFCAKSNNRKADNTVHILFLNGGINAIIIQTILMQYFANITK